MKQSVFDSFTNLYSLTKTLRFELVPEPATENYLKKHNQTGKNPLEIDENIDNLYHSTMKPMFDDLHRAFITESLNGVELDQSDLQRLEDAYRKLKKLSKDRKMNAKRIEKLEGRGNKGIIPTLQLKLRKQVVSTFQKTAATWKKKYASVVTLKGNDHTVLTGQEILKVLTFLHADDPEKKAAIATFHTFFTYLSGFNQNRENYYTEEDKATGVANRVVNENLMRFLDSRGALEEIIASGPDLKSYAPKLALDRYHTYLVQEHMDAFNEKVIGAINYEVNQFMQKNKIKLPKLKTLYKQIGSEKRSIDILQIHKGEEVWDKLQELVDNQRQTVTINKQEMILLDELEKRIMEFFHDPQSYELGHIFFHRSAINTISHRWFTGGWSMLAEKLMEDKAFSKNKEGEITIKDISLAQIKHALDTIEEQTPEHMFKEGTREHPDEYKKVYSPGSLWQTFLNIWQVEMTQNFQKIRVLLKEFETKKQEPFHKKMHSVWLKHICDAFLAIERMVRYNKIKGKEDGDAEFYELPDTYLNESKLIGYYNAFRNYISQKPYSTDKIKLNFENSSLLDGWDINKEIDNTGILLRTGDRYYLAIPRKEYRRCFDRTKHPNLYTPDDTGWEKMEYKLLPDISKMIPKCTTQIKDVKKHFKDGEQNYLLFNTKTFSKPLEISKRIYDLNNTLYKKDDMNQIVETDGVKLFQKGYLQAGGNKQIYKQALHDWIDFCKSFLHSYNSCQFFDYSPLQATHAYQSLEEFYKDVDKQSYAVQFVPINSTELNKLVDDGACYLFRIYNKDFADGVKTDSKQNIHTAYFKELFSNQNIQSKRLKLNGQAEVFWRKKSIEKKVDVKRSKNHEVIQHRRFAKDKYLFHVPITINFGAGNMRIKELNQLIADKTDNNKDIHYLGIDRGEKHLIYYCLIDINGNIKKQGSFNKIYIDNELDEKQINHVYENGELTDIQLVPTGKKVNYIDYHLLLDYYEQKRDLARKSWQEIGKIKDLKEGYLSQVIHEIYQMIIEHNAIIVLEDLNREFKAKRTAKVEKAVYKKFELALAKKLNHLILKNRKPDEPGGVLQAYQLTPAIEAGKISYFENAKEWGIIKKVRAAYTSTTDPLTRWRKHLYLPSAATIPRTQEFFHPKKGVQIYWDNTHGCYRFDYVWKNLYTTKKESWSLYAYEGLERFRWDHKKRTLVPVNVYQDLKELFEHIDRTKQINEQIHNTEKFNWKELARCWNMLNQIRNTNRQEQGDSADFIQSPTYAEQIQGFFDSRKHAYYKEKFGRELPENGDANGAYHIAYSI